MAALMTEIAVILPCYNEEAAIGKTVRDFHAAQGRHIHLPLRLSGATATSLAMKGQRE